MYGGDGRVLGNGDGVYGGFGVRPALQLNLSAVTFASVNLSGGANATASGASSIINTFYYGTVPQMTSVTYTANEGCTFPEKSDLYKETNGITVARTSDIEITVSGTPTGVANITIPDAILPAVTYTVTYKVVGGTWSDGSTADETETVQRGSKPTSVPTGMKPDDGYTGGAWDTDPASAVITGAKTFTYSFTAKQAATVTKAPSAKNLTYTGSAQTLVDAGTASGGTMQYALGTEDAATGDYSASIPTGTDAGT